MMTASTEHSKRFIRRTKLVGNEYHKNFYKLDRDVMTWLTSSEADVITPLMSKIYLRMVNAPARYFEGEGVLRFEAENREGKQVKAWDVLRETLGVASATAHKALTWLHDKGLIGYFAGKNGVGIRIFLNRAVSSIGVRAAGVALNCDQKILHTSHVSFADGPASTGETPFNDSYAVREMLDTDLNPPAPKNGAQAKPIIGNSSDPATALTNNFQNSTPPDRREVSRVNSIAGKSEVAVPVNEIVWQLRSVLEPTLKSVAIQAAQREYERTREWLERSGIPKAVRVAQRESYGVLRAYGFFGAKKGNAKFSYDVGRSFHSPGGLSATADFGAASAVARPRTCAEKQLSEAAALDMAEACVALLKMQGRPIDVTVQQMMSGKDNSVNSTSSGDDDGQGRGGWLSAADAERVSALAHELIDGDSLP